jgi:hypothetical protein
VHGVTHAAFGNLTAQLPGCSVGCAIEKGVESEDFVANALLFVAKH